MIEPIHIISLGAGVQSSTMALMAAKGEINPMPAFAVFADTGDEPEAVYHWLEYLIPLLPFPVFKTRRKWPVGSVEPSDSDSRLSDNIVEWGHSQIPCFVAGNDGNPTIGKRQCTKHWKIVPVNRAIRRNTDTSGKRLADGTFTLWQGISIDEIGRMAINREKWIKNRWPLIELRMTRNDCKSWLKSNGHPEAPKSSCDYCPYKRRKQWQAMKMEAGRSWTNCIKVSRVLEARGEYLTADLKPIDQIDFTRPIDNHPELELSIQDECEGMCGV